MGRKGEDCGLDGVVVGGLEAEVLGVLGVLEAEGTRLSDATTPCSPDEET